MNIYLNNKILKTIFLLGLGLLLFVYYYTYKPMQGYQIYNYITEDTVYLTPEEWWIKNHSHISTN